MDIARETYLAILMDRDSNGPVVVASPEGGMDIEEVAEKFPDKIFKVCMYCCFMSCGYNVLHYDICSYALLKTFCMLLVC